MKKYWLITVVRTGCFSLTSLTIAKTPAEWLAREGTPSDDPRENFHLVFAMEISEEEFMKLCLPARKDLPHV